MISYDIQSKYMKMNISKGQKQAGFTLIELMVVIALIAALSVIGVQAGNGAIKRAHKMQAQADITKLAQAVESYYADNNVYPSVTTSANNFTPNATDVAVVTDGAGSGATLVRALVGEEVTPTLNVRKISYLEADVAEGGEGGIDYGGTYSFTDRKGVPYEVHWDADYDGQLANPFDGTAPNLRKGVVALGRGVIDVDDWGATATGLHQAVKTW